MRFLARLAGNLNEFRASEFDEALTYFLSESGDALRAENSDLSVCMRETSVPGPPPAGWRPVWDIRHGPDSAAFGATFHRWYSDAGNFHKDGMVVALAQTAGETRAFRRRDLVSDAAWNRSPVQEMFEELGIEDRLVSAVPVGTETEIILTSYRRGKEGAFTSEDRMMAEQIATAVRPFLRRLALTYGFGTGLAPLTPRERTVMTALLSGDREKEISKQLGLTSRSLHQYVIAVYRKLGVSSRVQLMSDFYSAKPQLLVETEQDAL